VCFEVDRLDARSIVGLPHDLVAERLPGLADERFGCVQRLRPPHMALANATGKVVDLLA
jgi:hypothetical protein